MIADRFIVRLVITVEVKGGTMPSGDSTSMAMALAEVVAAQALAQNTENESRILPSKVSVRRKKAPK